MKVHLKLSAVSWFTTGKPVAAASASLRPASSIWNGRSVALDTTCTTGIRMMVILRCNVSYTLSVVVCDVCIIYVQKWNDK